jgi:chromosome segregation ATPase
MALTDLTEDRPRSGWLRQAQRLAGTHSTFGTKTVTAVEHERQQLDAASDRAEAERASLAEAREAELARELELALARLSGMERHVAQEKAATETTDQRLKALKEQSDEGARRIAALEEELAAERGGADLQRNEIESLRNSLDLTISENSRMSARVDLADSLLAESRVQADSLLAEAVTADVKRIKTVDVAHRTDERYQAEARKLQDDLAAMTARARTAETLLADSRECLVIRIAEAEKLARDLATANESSRDLERKCQDLQDQLAAREMRLREAEKSRQTLMAKTYKLLDSYQSRDRALTRAEEKIKQLDQWIVRLEAQARRNVNEANSVIAVTQPQPSTEIVLSAEDPREIKRRKWMELARELAKLSLKRHVQHPVVEHLQAISTPSLLAGTITY